MNCPYCGEKAKFMTSEEFYGKDFGANLYVCRPCDAYVGTHGRSKQPLGTMANQRLREFRKSAHKLFDPLWRGKGKMSRSKAYAWMAEVMDLPGEKAHIGMFDDNQCKLLIEKVKEKRGLN